MKRPPHLLATSCLLALVLATLVNAQSDYQDRPAVFKITNQVLNKDVQAFTFTVPAFGNTINRTGKGGFEPATFRTRLTATRDSPNRIYDETDAGLHHYDVYASGYLDGADVRVYRIVNGKVELVRTDKVAPNGTVLEYWNNIGGNKIIPADTTRAQFAWANWSRPGSSRWFSVMAVDKAGNISKPAMPISLEQRVPEKGVRPEIRQERFRPIRNTNDTEPPAAPTNFIATYNDQGIVEMSWDAVDSTDLAGYRIVRTDTDPKQHRGLYIELESTSAKTKIKKGDMVIVSKMLKDFEPSWLSNRMGNLNREIQGYYPDNVPNGFWPNQPGETKSWKLVRHTAETPVTDPGEYFFQMTLGPGDSAKVGHSGIPDISITTQEFYPVPIDGAEYVMEVWMKADAPNASPVYFTWHGDDGVGSFVGRHEIKPTLEWQKHEIRFTGKSTDVGHHAYFVLEASGPGTFSFDNYRVYRADTKYLDYLPHEYEQLRNSGMRAMRGHAPVKTKRMITYSMSQFLGAPGQAEGVPMGNTLVQLLRACHAAKIDPWIQIQHHMSPDEWMAFVEYMAAPYDPKVDTAQTKPFAYLRHRQGQSTPWAEVFDKIYFEISNETWNRLFRPWTFDPMVDSENGKEYKAGEVYGLFHDYVVSTMQNSPYWSSIMDAKFVHVIGGWSGTLRRDNNGLPADRGFTADALRASKTGEFFTIGAYNGGWDEGEGPPQPKPSSYFNVLSQVNQTIIPRASILQELAARHRKHGRSIGIGTYEAGPGYALNGLNNARVTPSQAEGQEQVMKSKLAGTATLDSFLARASYGFTLDNFFTFSSGDLWKSHAKYRRGGHPHASFLPLQIFNNYATGEMLVVETQSVPTINLIESKRRQSVDNAPLVAVYATRRQDQLAVFVISRKFPHYPNSVGEGYTPTTLKLPLQHAASVTLFRFTGDITDTNIHEHHVVAETISIDPKTIGKDGTFVVNEATGARAKGLPPSEVLLYIFK